MSESPPALPYHIQVEASPKRVQVLFNGHIVADSQRALIMIETRLAPIYYLPLEDVSMDFLERTDYRTHCPFKGNAAYWTLRVGEQSAENSVWSYENPLPEAEPVRGYLAFYRDRMDAWVEAGEEVSISPPGEHHAHGNPLVDWVMRDAWEAMSIAELLSRLAGQLVAIGVPLLRANLLVRTLHPQVMGASHVWSRDTDAVHVEEIRHARADEEKFLTSPFVPIFEGRGGIRRRLAGPGAVLDFPMLRELAEAGASDYVAVPITFSDGQIHALTLVTDAEDGFRTQDLGHIHEILPLISRFVEVHSLRHRARTLLETYLGRHTGGRVLDGLIKRGDGEVITAVIWWADLRGSTALTERIPRDTYLALLNQFFESTAGSVIEHGGEVLKFIGDAVLAIFVLRDIPDAGERALAAAIEALDRIEKLNAARSEDGAPVVEIAMALHRGEVSYGNIGVAGRLDFTVLGPAVNEVARLEGLSKQLGHSVVASRSFAELVPGKLASLGDHELRGVSNAQEVFGLPAAVGDPLRQSSRPSQARRSAPSGS